MKTKVSLKTMIVSALLLVCGLSTYADNKSNLIYNSEEVNGVMVGQTVYKMDGNTLANYMKYNYKYDDQKRMTESEAMKWDADRGIWHNDMCIRYAYQGKSVTTTYYKWSNKKGEYVLVPEMTVTMDNPSM
ncbi:DUF3836 domain-containing protein [Bacteroides helcogenes]|uniref:DUF3836 domain-containing protein n=1 Tax=Bacteroides helcogenes (strain ATCC 35417 / DSM 20613 / JCM 6297 / CCUG 15421 / P 36-108) TaxID=693979 RepID=E6SMX2_BACT6|nr:DUF3836 domain-containing protein [Bacteroides helcogenes]ADV42688.1 hypothetical protein Bache_0665 [Bacteroides helcogenes P 36-108]MDY5239518.1 DUF3836 domain-containing protein [Bacteroides helcogenes]